MLRLQCAFTLIELLVVITIIAILSGMILSGVGLMRERSRRVEAQQVVDQLVIALETYQTSDTRKRHYPLQPELYPTPVAAMTPHVFALLPQAGASAGVLSLMMEQDLMVRGSGSLRDSVLVDPWGRPYNYQLVRPTPTIGTSRLEDWNWDANHAPPRPRARNRTAGDTAAPFPYVWSYGSDGLADDTSQWIYRADSRN